MDHTKKGEGSHFSKRQAWNTQDLHSSNCAALPALVVPLPAAPSESASPVTSCQTQQSPLPTRLQHTNTVHDDRCFCHVQHAPCSLGSHRAGPTPLTSGSEQAMGSIVAHSAWPHLVQHLKAQAPSRSLVEPRVLWAARAHSPLTWHQLPPCPPRGSTKRHLCRSCTHR